MYIDLFIPSVHDAYKFFNQQNALEFIAELTKRGTVSGVIEILSDYFLPNIGDLNFLAGPQFRYQLFSTYNKNIAVTEKLYNIGFKVGVSKSF